MIARERETVAPAFPILMCSAMNGRGGFAMVQKPSRPRLDLIMG